MASVALVSIAITFMPFASPGLASAVGISIAVYASFRTGLHSYRYVSSLLVVIAVAVIIRLNPVGATLDLRLAGTFALIAGLSPLILRPLARTQDGPVLHVYGLMFATYGVIGAVLSTSERFLGGFVPLQSRAIATAVNAAFFLLSIAVGTLVARLIARRQHAARRNLDSPATVSGSRAWKLATLAFLGYIGLTRLADISNVGQIPVMVRWVFVLAAVAVWLAWRRGQIGAPIALSIGLLVLVDTIGGVGTGSIAAGMAPVLAIFAAEMHVRRRVPWLVLALGALLALSLNAVKGEFREGYGLRRAAVSQELIEAGAGFTREGVLGIASLSDPVVLSSSAKRFAYASGGVHGYIFDAVPKSYDHWGARTYKFLPFAVVPRVIFPWKPRATFGNEFGRELDLLSGSDQVTSANLPVSAEAYLAYGWLGLAVGAIVIGALLGSCNRLASGTSDRSVLVGALLVVVITGGIESNSTQAVGLLPATFAVALIGVSILVPKGGSAS